MKEIYNTKAKILIVDDARINLEIAKKVLGKEHYDLSIADNGLSALEMMQETDFDLILLDIMMSDMDGFETYTKMKEIERLKDIPVIFLSAKTEIEATITAFELGAVDYIKKPFNASELKARVRTHVELKKVREELELKNKRLQDAYDELEVLAITDPLTKLFNRREIMKRLEAEVIIYTIRKTPFSVMLVDIDYFKDINDKYGHGFGDHVLRSVADIFKAHIRKKDSVSRWGGEEFLILLPDTDVSSAVLVAEKLRITIENSPFDLGDSQLKVTTTIGVNVYSKLQSLDTFLSDADSAMYRGKQNGRNCVVLHQENDIARRSGSNTRE